MKTKTLLIVSLFFVGIVANAQSTFDKLLFEEAQTAYTNKKYELCLSKLEELEQRNVKGLIILNLRIKARYAIVQSHEKRLDYLSGQFNTLSKLHQDIDYYLSNYDNPDFSTQYKEVYDISKVANQYPKNLEQWESYLQKIQNEEKAKKQRIIDDFVKSLITIEKGYYYAGIPYYRFLWENAHKNVPAYMENYPSSIYKNYTDKDRLKAYYELNTVIPRKIEIDYNFRVSNGFITEELVWALYDNNIFVNNPEGVFRLHTENRLQTIISLLNKKTGLKFRLITAEENDYLMRGGTKNIEKLYSFEDKKIIGGNKRKGYEYETNYYCAYNFNANDEAHKREINQLPFGGLVRTQAYEMYNSFTGKVSSISNRPLIYFMNTLGPDNFKHGFEPDYMWHNNSDNGWSYFLLVTED